MKGSVMNQFERVQRTLLSRLTVVFIAGTIFLTSTGIGLAQQSVLRADQIKERNVTSKLPFFAPKHIAIPVAVSAFPDELYQAPRSWTERAYPKLIHYKKLDKGGHFAAWEQPQIFSEEIRAAFRSLR
jgi:pimeloyl-ACP methyl ester carboxylesterase